MLPVYREIGNSILQQQKKEGWGTKVIERLIPDLKKEFPDLKGLSPRNFKYKRSFAASYPAFGMGQDQISQVHNNDNHDFKLVQQSVAQLPWGHNCTLLDKLKQ